jgi:hypothetical protein
MTDGTPYSEVLRFLKQRKNLIENLLDVCVFGYKGKSYQVKVLDDAGIVNHINLETFQLPKLNYVGQCPYHKGPSKCSRAALAQILFHLVPPIAS